MTKEEVLDFINSNLSCYLATSEETQPRVRGMMAYRADDHGILFHTGKSKDLYKQLLANPLTEVCFYNENKSMQVRVQGRAVIEENDGLKNEIVAARPFLKPWVDEMGLDILVVFRITEARACVWTFGTNFAPKTYIQITQ